MKGKTFILLVILLALDRGLKIILLKGLVPALSFFDFFPRLRLHKNYGIAFDLALPPRLILMVSSIILLILLLIFLTNLKTQDLRTSALFALILGASSNFYDRLIYGFAIDVVEVAPGSIWNLADLLILWGLLFLVFRGKPKLINDQ